MIIGLLRCYKHPMIKDRVAAMTIKESGHIPIFFSINDVNFEDRTINCKRLKEGIWVDETSCFPDVVYNDLPIRKKADPAMYLKLENEGIPFTAHRFGLSKVNFQAIIEKDSYVKSFLIESVRVDNFEQLLLFLKKHKSIVVKPNRGHKGLGIMIITIDEESEICLEHYNGSKQKLLVEELENLLEERIQYSSYHVQKTINSITKYDQPFNIRSYVGRTKGGTWINVFYYATVSLTGSKVVNISRESSSICYIKDFLNLNYGDKSKSILQNLRKLSLSVANSVQKHFDFEIDALGIDYGVDEFGKPYIFEINAFPATRPFDALAEYHLAQFAIYLGEKSV